MKDFFIKKEDRLKKYKDFSVEKSSQVYCPVCNKGFLNKYSLSNHFLIRGFADGPHYIDDLHKQYFLENKKRKWEDHLLEVQNRVYKKRCAKCGQGFSVQYENRFAKKCNDCLKKYPTKIKNPQKILITYPCPRCKEAVTALKYSSNKICLYCRKLEREKVINQNLEIPVKLNCSCCGNTFYYKKKHIKDHTVRKLCPVCEKDPYRFKKNKKYKTVLRLLEETTLTRSEINELLNLETDFVREAAIEKFGDDWYNKRVKFIRKRGLLQAIYQKPSGLELLFSEKLKMPFESNCWMVLYINNEPKKSEIDLKIPIRERKFAVFIDGESFHGSKSIFFRPNSILIDTLKAKRLSEMGYYSIRYSETEVKSGWALKHFNSLYDKFLNNTPKYYYRNWLTDEEISVP